VLVLDLICYVLVECQLSVFIRETHWRSLTLIKNKLMCVVHQRFRSGIVVCMLLNRHPIILFILVFDIYFQIFLERMIHMLYVSILLRGFFIIQYWMKQNIFEDFSSNLLYIYNYAVIYTREYPLIDQQYGE
jgi:hypothetical protein